MRADRSPGAIIRALRPRAAFLKLIRPSMSLLFVLRWNAGLIGWLAAMPSASLPLLCGADANLLHASNEGTFDAHPSVTPK